jgi:hypothetical protein
MAIIYMRAAHNIVIDAQEARAQTHQRAAGGGPNPLLRANDHIASPPEIQAFQHVVVWRNGNGGILTCFSATRSYTEDKFAPIKSI